MSGNSRGSSFGWLAVARRTAERAGFRKTRREPQGESFSHLGEVSPDVHVFFQRVTFTETAPEVLFGIRVPDFELEWTARLKHVGVSEFGESPPFGLHGANIASLSPRPWVPFSPSDRDVAAVQVWLGRAFDYAKQLPSSMTGLTDAIEAGRIAGHDVGFWCGHPVKVRGFVPWLRRVHCVDLSERLLPLLENRTEPYDAKAMLDED